MAKALRMVHEDDPRLVIQQRIGHLVPKIEPLGANIMVAVYERPEKTQSGLFLPGQTRTEDQYQGKVGLVLDMGPIAFKEDDHHRFGGRLPEVGDWIVYSIGETFAFMLGDTKIRLVEDVAVKAIVDEPDIVL